MSVKRINTENVRETEYHQFHNLRDRLTVFINSLEISEISLPTYDHETNIFVPFPPERSSGEFAFSRFT